MRVVVFGMGRDRVVELVRSLDAPVSSVQARSDYEASADLKSGQADIAIGVCQSGAGGALALPRALIGADACVQLSNPTRPPSEQDIRQAVEGNKRVFGMAVGHVDRIVPQLIRALSDQRQE